MIAQIEAAGGRVDGVWFCPHAPEDGCRCRKPQPGLLQQAARVLGLDLSRSYFIGDAESDVEAARAAGCRPVLVRTGRGQEQLRLLQETSSEGLHVAEDLADAVNWVYDGMRAESKKAA
jgi:D-glycero-D-manno-heptose 1,7-bisphosphate phosphatase